MDAEYIAPTGIRSPDHPAHSQSLYRLCYLAHTITTTFQSFFRRYFITDQALNEHFRTKVHKRRLKALELEPYTIEESERAAGKGSYLAPKKRKIETQTPVDETEQKSQDVKMN